MSLNSNSRRGSSSISSQDSSEPSTPTKDKTPNFKYITNNGNNKSNNNDNIERYKSKKLNPVRRCQSMKNAIANINTSNNNITSSSSTSKNNNNTNSIASMKNGQILSLKNRRTSSTPNSIENGRNNSNDFMKYYQFKNNKPNPLLAFNIVMLDHKDNYRDRDQNKCCVLVMGSSNCGKTALIRQFKRFIEEQKNNLSNGINNSNNKDEDDNEDNNNNIQENHINNNNNNNVNKKPNLFVNFQELDSLEKCYPHSPITIYQPEAYIVVYAVNNRESFENAKRLISEIYKWDDVESKPIILVANKSDLVRGRIISKQEGRQLAMNNNCKFIEISCAISHNVDSLLAGIGVQISLKNNSRQSTINNRKPSLFKRILRKASLNKSKSCDNLLHVL